MSERPDFGDIYSEHEGVVLSCKAVAPGVTIHDLVAAFHRGQQEAAPGDEYSGNPSKWPDVRGVSAVLDTIMDALYPPTPSTGA